MVTMAEAREKEALAVAVNALRAIYEKDIPSFDFEDAVAAVLEDIERIAKNALARIEALTKAGG